LSDNRDIFCERRCPYGAKGKEEAQQALWPALQAETEVEYFIGDGGYDTLAIFDFI